MRHDACLAGSAGATSDRRSALAAASVANSSSVTPAIPRSVASLTTFGQRAEGIESRAFIVRAWLSMTPIAVPNFSGPPKALMMARKLSMQESLHSVAIPVNTACSVPAATLCSMDRQEALHKRQGARLAAARKQAGYRSARAAATENDWRYSSYAAHERGTRTIGLDDAERYAVRFRAEGVKVTAKSILFDSSDVPEQRAIPGIVMVPRLSWVSASAMADVGDVPHPKDAPTTPFADLPKGDWFGLKVVGDSMDRIAPDGALILVNRLDRRLVRHKFYVFADRGEATFKRFVDKPVKRLEPYSTNPAHEPIYPHRDVIVIGRVARVITDLR